MRHALVRRTLIALPLAVLLAAAGIPDARAQQWQACYVGGDLAGGRAFAAVTAERYGDWFEVRGRIRSTARGRVYSFKADGHSGAGRMFARHEYESGAVYVRIRDLSESRFVMEVQGHGVQHLRRTKC